MKMLEPDEAVCSTHHCSLQWREDGDGESGPGEPYLYCPQCYEEQLPGCPKCKSLLEISSRYTRNYGGGYDTFEKCSNLKCDYAEVYV